MNLNINNPNINKRNSTEKKYGNLVVETSLRNNTGVIDISNPRTFSNANLEQPTPISNNLNSAATSSISSSTTNATSTSNTIVKTKPLVDKNVRNMINVTNSMHLKRGQKISLNSMSQNLEKLIVALDWDINLNKNTDFDLDISVFMVDINGTTAEQNFIFYGNPKSRDKGLVLNEDHNSSLKKGFNDTIQLNLNLISSNISKLAFTITIYEAESRHQSFSNVSKGYFRIIDTKTKNELINYKFTENLNNETALVAAEIYRHKDQWKLAPIGSGFFGGLKALCDNYGIETTD